METNTQVTIDLAEILTAKELESFTAKAEESGANNLTEHFKNVFLGEEPNSKTAA